MMPLRYAGLFVGIGFLVLGCAAPTPTSTLVPVTVTPRPVTALPSLTPLPTVTPAPSLISSLPTGAPPSAFPSQIAATPGTSAPPVSTSALLAITPIVGLTPVASEPKPLPGSPPPLDIKLPPHWKLGYSIVPVRYGPEEAGMNVAAYSGPVQGGTAQIIVLWGFPSLGPPPTPAGPQSLTTVPGTPAPDLQMQLLWADGYRLLQGTVVDITCNMGNYGQRNDFTVGGLPAVGQYYGVSQCQGEPDAMGWFAGVNQYGGNFLFYVNIQPPEAYNNARAEVQKILDTVVFRKPAATPVAPPPTNTVPAAPGTAAPK